MHSLLSFSLSVLLILVSQRVEDMVIELFGSDIMRDEIEEELLIHRGHGPKVLEVFVGFYVLGKCLLSIENNPNLIIFGFCTT